MRVCVQITSCMCLALSALCADPTYQPAFGASDAGSIIYQAFGHIPQPQAAISHPAEHTSHPKRICQSSYMQTFEHWSAMESLHVSSAWIIAQVRARYLACRQHQACTHPTPCNESELFSMAIQHVACGAAHCALLASPALLTQCFCLLSPHARSYRRPCQS